MVRVVDLQHEGLPGKSMSVKKKPQLHRNGAKALKKKDGHTPALFS
jgi:hypothetical protein